MKVSKYLEKVAALNSRKRAIKRNEARELKDINAAFDLLCAQFEEALLGTPWDDKNSDYELNGCDIYLDEINPFTDFNLTWVNWCETWNKTHLTKANNMAFNERNINNLKTNKHDRPVYFANNQRTHLYWAL